MRLYGPIARQSFMLGVCFDEDLFRHAIKIHVAIFACFYHPSSIVAYNFAYLPLLRHPQFCMLAILAPSTPITCSESCI